LVEISDVVSVCAGAACPYPSVAEVTPAPKIRNRSARIYERRPSTRITEIPAVLAKDALFM
jgi:hypothetical protein